MMFDISVKVHKVEGILERILGVVRYRGYQLRTIQAEAIADDRFFCISLHVSHPREQCHLVRHLEKLWDVESVEWTPVAVPRPEIPVPWQATV